MNRQRENRRTARYQKFWAVGILLSAAATMLLLPIGPASAVTRNWTGGDGNWSDTSKWFGGVLPASGDTVSAGFGDGIARTITYNVSAPSLNSVGLDLTGGSGTSTTLLITANNLTSSFEYVGYNGRGDINQSGGTNTISSGAGFLDIGVFTGATGTYTLGGTGIMFVNTNEYVGDVGIGFFNQTGGTHNLTGGSATALYLGYNAAGGGGTYVLNAGTLSAGGGKEYVGYNTSGTFNQMGGLNNSILELNLGTVFGSTGTYNLSGSGLINSQIESVGGGGVGTFNQMGGTNNITSKNNLLIALNIGPTGTYNLSGGALNVTDTKGTCYAVGALNVTGTGVLTVAGMLQIGNQPGSAVNLNGGTINTAALNVLGVPARFNWSSGILNLTSNVTWDPTGGATVTSPAFGAARTLGANQTLMITGDETLGGVGAFSLVVDTGSTHYVTGTLTVSPTGTITQNAGSTLYAATFTQAGGTVNGTLQNRGVFNYQSGAFNGRLLNQGSINLGPNFTAGNGVENDSSVTLAAGQTLTANGAGLDNLGQFVLNGGTISGSGPVTNEFGGTVQGHGTVNPPLGNYGTLSASGVLAAAGGITNFGLVQGNGSISGAFSNDVVGTVAVAAGNSLAITADWTNAGLIALQGTTARLGGGAIANSGTIQGLGLLTSSVANTGTIEALGGTLSVGGALTNPAGGLLTTGTGSKLLVTAGLAANGGVVNLTGGTFDNNGHPLDNAGQISGWGILRTGGSGLDNHGSITLTGGTTTVNGPVTNEDGKTITVAYNPAIFTGLVNNTGTGTFNIVSTTATFAGGSSGMFNGTFTNNPGAAFGKAGSGALEIDGPPTLGNSSSVAVNDTGTLRFKAIVGSAAIGAGVTATVSNSATLELAGFVSALSSGPGGPAPAGRVNVTNNSTAAAGVLVSGTHQQVGNIDGSGTTQVNAGSDLTADHIIQGALMIRGTAGSPGFVTIAASDASGSPLRQSTGIALAASLTSDSPFGALGIGLPHLSAATTDSADLAVLAMGKSVGSDSPAPVPEPSALLLVLLAVLAVVSTLFVRHHFNILFSTASENALTASQQTGQES